ncbi:hypothetical protein R9C00_02855 [Flammeovirgaceae bacterium SG7u.111]|nr:hypothetical protein [Flammeovirgaceae bacterium SG7u.132]WPO36380.1 hypothetical protein R9C00_02855 [Flammeovirgaceae bacterium SG7u.111]
MNTQLFFFSIAVVLFIIGVHQTFYYGLRESYWAYMLSLGSFFYFLYKKGQEKEKDESTSNATKKKGEK